MAKFFDANYNITKIVTENGDIKSLEINNKEVNLNGEVDVESNKTVSITANGTVEITPSSGKDAMAKVTATVNVPPLKADKYFMWFNHNNTSTVSWLGFGLDDTTSFESYLNGTRATVGIFIKGKNSLDDFTVGETLTIYRCGYPLQSKECTVSAKTSSNVTFSYTISGNAYTLTVDRSSTFASNMLSAFARYDGITYLPEWHKTTINTNGATMLETTSDGIQSVTVNVPASTVEPTKMAFKAFSPANGTAVSWSLSQGAGGYLMFGATSNTEDITSLAQATSIQDIIDGNTTSITVKQSGPSSDTYKCTFSVACEGSGYPYSFTFTPTAVGSAFTNKVAIGRMV